jgi:isopenicillin-N N-acyltransferase like protein
LAHHVSREDSPGARGRAFGSAHRAAIANTVTVYRRMLDESAGIGDDDVVRLGARVGDRVSAEWPTLGEELVGMAEGAAVDVEVLWAVNARTELLGGGGECTLIGRVDGARARLAQNWDWHPDLSPSRVVWTVEHDGTWFTTVTEAGMLAKLGLNGRGLACGLNFLECSVDGGVDGLPIHVLLRLLLQESGSLAEALALLLRAPVAASSCITVAGAEPEDAGVVAVELSPGGPALVWPDADGVLVHTNHFLGALPSGVDEQPAEHPSTLLRHARTCDLLRHGATDERALSCHFPSPEPVCRHEDDAAEWAERRVTLLSVVIDPAAPALRVTEGPPCETPFEPVPLPAA